MLPLLSNMLRLNLMSCNKERCKNKECRKKKGQSSVQAFQKFLQENPDSLEARIYDV